MADIAVRRTAASRRGVVLQRKINTFILKSVVLGIGIMSRTYLPYVVAGVFMRFTGRFESIHLTYPAEPRFRHAYAFQSRFLTPIYDYLEWMPSPIAVFRQGGANGLTFAAAVDEAELIRPRNQTKLRLLLERFRFIRLLLGARQVTLGGILPSYLDRENIETPNLTVNDPRPATRCALLGSIEQIVERDFGGVRPPIILFGGAGFIGSDLAEALHANGDPVFIIDKLRPDYSEEEYLTEHRDKAVIIVDVARRGAIRSLIKKLWPGVVLLNETYPEPTGKTLSQLKAQGVKVRHVVGLEGKQFPNLPGAYASAVACCAAHRVDASTQAVVKEL